MPDRWSARCQPDPIENRITTRNMTSKAWFHQPSSPRWKGSRYRLNMIPIRLPSLAERRDDIPALVLHFLNHVNQAQGSNVNLT